MASISKKLCKCSKIKMNINDRKFEEIKKEVEKEAEDKSRFIVAETLSDGTIIEMLFDPQKNETSLAIFANDAIKEQKTFTHNGILLKPHSAEKDLLKHKVVLFPSKALEYGTQTRLIQDIQAFIHRYLSVSIFFEYPSRLSAVIRPKTGLAPA